MNQLRPSVIVTAAAATPKAIAEQLRQAVKQAKWQTGRITVSVGIASAIKTDNETTIYKELIRPYMPLRKMVETSLHTV